MARPEIYVSVDIESTKGKGQPGKYSMYQLGACLVKEPGFTFFAELKLLNDNHDPKSLEVCRVTLEELKNRGAPPEEVMSKFNEWLQWIKNVRNGKLIFVGFNAPFDWKFVDWYFYEFLGFNPFGISGIDAKAYFMGMAGCLWQETGKRKIKKLLKVVKPHTHHALQDAIEQAELFEEMLEFNCILKEKLRAAGLI